MLTCGVITQAIVVIYETNVQVYAYTWRYTCFNWYMFQLHPMCSETGADACQYRGISPVGL